MDCKITTRPAPGGLVTLQVRLPGNRTVWDVKGDPLAPEEAFFLRQDILTGRVRPVLRKGV